MCMHGHVEAQVFADNAPFPDPSALLITPDHYVTRMLASQGMALEDLGVGRLDGGAVESDARAIWRRLCGSWHLFRGTPSRYWLEHELVEVFGVDQPPSAQTADALFDTISARSPSRTSAAADARPVRHRADLHDGPGDLPLSEHPGWPTGARGAGDADVPPGRRGARARAPTGSAT